MFCEVRTMFRVMAPPRAAIVPEVMIRICGVNPQDNFQGVHDVFCSVHQELSEKKNRQPSGQRFQSSGGDFIW
jgi:hypothetical protein